MDKIFTNSILNGFEIKASYFQRTIDEIFIPMLKMDRDE